MTGKNFRVTAEVVNGKCPTCDEYTMLVGLSKSFYRCMNCGSDLEQHINGKISYLPVLTSMGDKVPYVKDWIE
jgi:uncharacterized protein (DUF983 family)